MLPAQILLVHPGALAWRLPSPFITDSTLAVVRPWLLAARAEGLLPLGQLPLACIVVQLQHLGEALEQTRNGLLRAQLAVLQQLHIAGVQLVAALQQRSHTGARVQLGLLETAQSAMCIATAVARQTLQLVAAIVVDVGAQFLGQTLPAPLVGLDVEPALLAGQAAHQAWHLLVAPLCVALQLPQIAVDALRRAVPTQAALQYLCISRQIGGSLREAEVSE